MSLKRTVPNTALAVPLADVKLACGIPSSDTSMDALITRYIKGARSFIEDETSLVLLPETWVESLPTFPMPLIYPLAPNWNYTLTRTPLLDYQDQSTIRFSIGPVTAVSVMYYDANNADTPLTGGTDYYFMNPTRLQASITPVHLWPVCFPRPDAVRITLSVGYSTLPDNITDAVMALAATRFTYRESESEKATKELSAGLSRIIEQVRNSA